MNKGQRQSALVNAIANDDNRKARTENGAVTLKSSMDSVLDLFSHGSAYRTRSDRDAEDLFQRAFASDRDLAMKCLFYIRDIRGGQGERKVFRTILAFLAVYSPESVKKNFQFIADMGRWDDFFVLRGTTLEKDAFTFMREQWRKDIQGLKDGVDSISLLGKWAPSANASSAQTKRDAHAFYTFLGLNERTYRKTLSKLREKLRLVERAMSSRNFSAIDYEHVPSKASLLYRKAFGKQDTERYGAYLKALEKGEAKVNASTLYPYDLVRPIILGQVSGPASNDAKLMDAQWKALPSFVPQDSGNTLVVIDTSSSMHSPGYYPLASSIGIGLYLAEHNEGLFKNCFITFESSPKMHRVVGNNLYEKVTAVKGASWGGDTNLLATFDLILGAAVQNHLPESEMPHRLFIISDMEFNQACKGMTNFEAIDKKYQDAGYERPLLVFWNVNAKNDNSPVRYDERGTMLVSGQSPAIFKSVMESKTVTPFDLMMDVLNKERYAGITA